MQWLWVFLTAAFTAGQASGDLNNARFYNGSERPSAKDSNTNLLPALIRDENGAPSSTVSIQQQLDRAAASEKASQPSTNLSQFESQSPLTLPHDSDHIWSKISPPPEIAGPSAGLFAGLSQFNPSANLRTITNASDDAVAAAFLFVIKKRMITPTNAWLALSGQPANPSSREHLAQLTNAGVNFIQPTHDNLITAAELVSTRAKESGLAIVLLSTHGFSAEGHYLLMPENARTSLSMMGVSADDLIMILEASAAKRRVLILDSCRTEAVLAPAPAMLAAKAPSDDIIPPWFLRRVDQTMTPVAVVYACASRHKSWNSSELGGGIFTHFFLEALESDETADDLGLIRLSTAVNYAEKQIRSWCERHHVPDPQEPGFVPTGLSSLPLSWSDTRRNAFLGLNERKQEAITYIENTFQIETLPIKPEVLRCLRDAEITSNKLQELLDEIDSMKAKKTTVAAGLFRHWWLGWFSEIPTPGKAQNTVFIETVPPFASVALDDLVISNRYALFTNVPTGSHNLTVRATGYETVEKRIEVAGTLAQCVRLELQSGILHVSVKPKSASIAIHSADGKFVDSPLQDPTLQTGTYTVVFELPGWTSWQTNINVQANRTNYVEYIFPRGALRLKSNFKDVEFFAGTRKLGLEGIHFFPPGDPIVTAVHGNESKQYQTNVIVNTTNEISIDFPPRSPEVTIQSNNAIITLTWPKVDGANGFYIFRGTNPVFAQSVLLTNCSNSEFSDGNPLVGQWNYYWVSSTNQAGTSREATMKSILIRAKEPPTIVQHPIDTNALVGNDVVLSVKAKGILPWYRWEVTFDGTNWISDAETNSPDKRLQTMGRTPAQRAIRARVVVGNTGGAVTSRVSVVNLKARSFNNFCLSVNPAERYSVKSGNIFAARAPGKSEKTGSFLVVRNPGTNGFVRFIRWDKNPPVLKDWGVLPDGTIIDHHKNVVGYFFD